MMPDNVFVLLQNCHTPFSRQCLVQFKFQPDLTDQSWFSSTEAKAGVRSKKNRVQVRLAHLSIAVTTSIGFFLFTFEGGHGNNEANTQCQELSPHWALWVDAQINHSAYCHNK